MNEEITISVVIPAYNAENFLARTIDSVLAQTYKPLEIIIIDDGSKDNTATVAKKYSDNVHYVFKENGGESSARNAGILNAKGEWIAFLDHDDVWHPHHLMNAVNTINKAKIVKWYGAPFDVFTHNSAEKLTIYKKNTVSESFINNIYYNDYLSVSQKQAIFTTSTMVIHKSVFVKAGMFNNELRIGDLDMWFRIALHFPQIGYYHQVAAHAYKQKTSRYTTQFDIVNTLAHYRNLETYAAQLSNETLKSAEPWIMARITQIIKARIVMDDRPSVKSMLSAYHKQLSLKWYVLAYAFLYCPYLFKIMILIHNKLSRKQRSLKKHGLLKTK